MTYLDIIHTDTETSHANIETGVRAIRAAQILLNTIGRIAHNRG